MKNPQNNKILIIDDEVNMLHMLSFALRKEGYETVTTQDAEEGVYLLSNAEFDCILCDLKMPKMGGLEFLQEVAQKNITVPVIMMSAFATVDGAVQAMKNGAYDFITKPFKIDEIVLILQKTAERELLRKENRRLLDRVIQLEGERSFRSIVGSSNAIKEVVQLAQKAATHDTTVLIRGESGTGKEMFARGIQFASPRADKPFVSVNCGAIPAQLMESEFFGYEKGAFTGADSKKRGLFLEADGGTLFLDEIGELPLGLQIKLLRVLQEQEIRPLGSNTTVKINVRIIGATSKDLEQEVAAGRFRKDLFYRLNIIMLVLPPLRERREDIPELARFFIRKHCARLGAPPPELSKEGLQSLYSYNWPGNVRELENAIERAIVFADEGVILPKDLPKTLAQKTSDAEGEEMFSSHSLKKGKEIMESHLIRRALEQTEGNKSQAARLLEISYPSLLSKLKDYMIDC